MLSDDELQKYCDLLESEFVLAIKPNPAEISSVLSKAKQDTIIETTFFQNDTIHQSSLFCLPSIASIGFDKK